MKVKELDKTVNVAWSPPAVHPILLAAGTAAHQLDASFSTTASLEIHALNLGEPGLDMTMQASVPSEQRFHKLVWGANGTIVGGCDAGLVQIYSAQKLLSHDNGLVARQDKHSGPVRSLDFNPFQANLLATGAGESEIYIWDLNNISTPMTPGAKPQPPEDVAWISWNRQVQHILSSTFATRCVVWDLRKNEPIIKLSDTQSRTRWKVVAWHPEVATQLCLASEEDLAPVIQLWDLRFATSPIRSLESHQRGVLSIAWCTQDPDLLLSCGKDNRILCWNPNSNIPGGEVVCEVATTTQWNFDVAWCPRNPALISSCSSDGHVSVYSLTGATQPQTTTSTKIADSFPGMDSYAQATPPQPAAVSVDLRKAPKWLRKPCGAVFGFGGKLVSFEHDRNAVAQAAVAHAATANVQQAGFVAPPVIPRIVTISQVVTEPELVARAELLESALQQGEYRDFCTARSTSSDSSHKKFLWECLKSNFAPEPSVELLSLLGFNTEEVNAKLNKYTDRSGDNSDENEQLVDGLGEKLNQLSTSGDKGDVFDNLGSSPAELAAPFKIHTGDDTDGLICQALLLGNTEAAVELCLRENRSAEAILLAMTAGPDLLARTQFRFFQKSKGYLSTLMAALVTRDWSQVIASCDLSSWKEAVVAALTHTRGEEFSRLCEQLGWRLETEVGGEYRKEAELCYAIAGNLHKLVDCWVHVQRPTTPSQIQELVEMVVLLRTASELKGQNVDICGTLGVVLSQYAELLASQGSLSSALVYVNRSQDDRGTLLRERLGVTLGYKPLHSQQQAVQQRRASSALSHRGSTAGVTSAHQPPYYYSQAQQNQIAAAASFPQNSFGSIPQQKPQVPHVPTYQPPSVAPLQPTAPIPPVPPPQPAQSSFPPMPGPSPSPGLGRPPSTSTRSKYVLDPSVTSGPTYGGPSPYGAPSSFSHSTPYNSVGAFNSPEPLAPSLPAAATDFYNPQVVAPAAQPQPVRHIASVGQSTAVTHAPPGWNDPPILHSSHRTQPKTEFAPTAPITHPLLGAVPQEQGPPSMNMQNGGFSDPMSGYNTQSLPGMPILQPQAPSQTYYPPAPQQLYQPPEIATPALPPQRIRQEPPKPKGPIPEEHLPLQTVFDQLRNTCATAANNPQLKRKLDDVAKKLEALYDALRESRLSPETLQSLHQIADFVRAGDYNGGLTTHMQLVSGPDFSQISSFMPGVKVLLQTASLLGVYL